jgi:hypothetical protein
MKLLLFAALLVRLVIPIDTGFLLLNWVVFVAAVLAVTAGVALVESIMARLRMPMVPNLLVGAGVMSAFGLVLMGNAR